LNSCLSLRDALAQNIDAIYDEVTNPVGVLLWLATRMAPTVAELEHWQEVPPTALQGALRMWLGAESEKDIESRFAAT